MSILRETARTDAKIILNARAYAELKFGKTLEQIAVDLGIREDYFQRVLNQSEPLSLHVATELASALGVGLNELADMDGQLMHIDNRIKKLEEELSKLKECRASLVKQKRLENVSTLTDSEKEIIANIVWELLMNGVVIQVTGQDAKELEHILCRFKGCNTYLHRPTTFNTDCGYRLGLVNAPFKILAYIPVAHGIVEYRDYRVLKESYLGGSRMKL